MRSNICQERASASPGRAHSSSLAAVSIGQFGLGSYNVAMCVSNSNNFNATILRCWEYPKFTDRRYISSIGSSSSSSSMTDRWAHFQQNPGLKLFVHPWTIHGIDGDFLPSVCSTGSSKSSLFCCLQLHLVGHSKLLLF